MSRRPSDERPVFNRLAALRRAAGMSRQELADMVGVHYQTIGYLERGEYSPSLALALDIADALGRPVEEVFRRRPFGPGPAGEKEEQAS